MGRVKLKSGLTATFWAYCSAIGQVAYKIRLLHEYPWSNYSITPGARTFEVEVVLSGASFNPPETHMMSVTWDDDLCAQMQLINKYLSLSLDSQLAIDVLINNERSRLNLTSYWWDKQTCCSHTQYIKSGFGNVYCQGCTVIGREIEGEVVWPKEEE